MGKKTFLQGNIYIFILFLENEDKITLENVNKISEFVKTCPIYKGLEYYCIISQIQFVIFVKTLNLVSIIESIS